MYYVLSFLAGAIVAFVVKHYEGAFLVTELAKAEAEVKSLRLTLAARTKAAVTAVRKKV